MQTKLTPHKFAEQIKAWADGKQLQCSQDGDFWMKTDNPDWTAKFYRVKPEQRLDITYSGYYASECKQFFSVFSTYGTLNSVPETEEDFTCWNLVGIIKVTTDIDTKKILSVEHLPV